mgnify:CR=1 FL=1
MTMKMTLTLTRSSLRSKVLHNKELVQDLPPRPPLVDRNHQSQVAKTEPHLPPPPLLVVSGHQRLLCQFQTAAQLSQIIHLEDRGHQCPTDPHLPLPPPLVDRSHQSQPVDLPPLAVLELTLDQHPTFPHPRPERELPLLQLRLPQFQPTLSRSTTLDPSLLFPRHQMQRMIWTTCSSLTLAWTC